MPCRSGEHDPDLWFSYGPRSTTAKQLCYGCPLLVPCRELGFRFEHGVYGGLSSSDRKRVDPRYRSLAETRSRRLAHALDRYARGSTAPRVLGNVVRQGVIHIERRK